MQGVQRRRLWLEGCRSRFGGQRTLGAPPFAPVGRGSGAASCHPPRRGMLALLWRRVEKRGRWGCKSANRQQHQQEQGAHWRPLPAALLLLLLRSVRSSVVACSTACVAARIGSRPFAVVPGRALLCTFQKSPLFIRIQHIVTSLVEPPCPGGTGTPAGCGSRGVVTTPFGGPCRSCISCIVGTFLWTFELTCAATQLPGGAVYLAAAMGQHSVFGGRKPLFKEIRCIVLRRRLQERRRPLCGPEQAWACGALSCRSHLLRTLHHRSHISVRTIRAAPLLDPRTALARAGVAREGHVGGCGRKHLAVSRCFGWFVHVACVYVILSSLPLYLRCGAAAAAATSALRHVTPRSNGGAWASQQLPACFRSNAGPAPQHTPHMDASRGPWRHCFAYLPILTWGRLGRSICWGLGAVPYMCPPGGARCLLLHFIPG